MGSDRWRTLLIEADEAYQAVTGACLRLAGGEVEEVSGPQFALAALERSSFDLVIWGVPSKGAPNRLEVISEIRLRTQALLLLLDGSIEIAQLDLDPAVAGYAAVVFGHSHVPAIETRDGGCTAPGCDRPADWCDIHHVWHWGRRSHGHRANDHAGRIAVHGAA